MTRRSQRDALCVDVLGPLRIVVDGTVVDVPGPRRRAVLALLAMAGGRALSVDELLDAVWSDTAPDSGRRALHSHISRLRGHLGTHADRLERDGNAYRLRLEPTALDAHHARDLAQRARALVDERPREAAELLADAIALWRGAALEEFPDVAPLAADAVALASLRLDLVDEWLEARLDAALQGTPDPDLLADATRALAAAPLRERTARVALRALASHGRVAEAMRAAHAFRTRLVDETGLDPSAAFTELERSIANGEVAVVAATNATTDPARADDVTEQHLVAPASAQPGFTRPSGPFVGREHDLAAARRQLAAHPLVTVVGPGGVGKTRFALELAADTAEDGSRAVRVIELATVEHASHVDDTLATTLRLNVRDASAIRDAAASVLSATPTMLVLDNCEHLIDACRELVADLLTRTSSLVVLATSREPLGLPAEQLVRLGPLPVPDAAHVDDDIESVPAVAAFLAHARRRVADFAIDRENAAAIAEIVRRLDGLPLAVELAAGRVGSLGVGDLHDRLGRALDLLGTGRSPGDDRHRTLRSTIDWSYRLLDEDERALLRAMAVFPAGLDLATVEQLAEARGITTDAAALTARLVDASVIVADLRGARARYRLLETVRSFALDALDAQGERDAAESALVAWALTLVETLRELGKGPREAEADERLAAELANLRAARDVALRRGAIDDLITITVSLEEMMLFRPAPEVHAWAAEVERMLDPGHPRYREIARPAGRAAWLRGDLNEADRIAVHSPDARGILQLYQGEYDQSQETLLGTARQSPPGLASIQLATAALAAVYADRLGDADDIVVRARTFLGRDDVPPACQAFVHYAHAELLAHRDLDAALDQYNVAIDLASAVGATFVVGVAKVGVVSALTRLGRLREAFDGYRWLVDYWRRAGNWTQMWTTLRNLSRALLDAGDPMCAAFVLAAADHAEGAASVDPRTAAEHEALNARLDELLGTDELHRIRARAIALPRTSVVEEALEAVDAALANTLDDGVCAPPASSS